MKRTLLVLGLVLWSFTSAYGKQAKVPGWEGVEKVFAQKGKTEGDMLKLAFPRTDLTVKVGEVTVEPGLALTSWIGFRKMGSRAMMMGDLVLLESEVGPVMNKLVAEGIKISALHNHLLKSVPTVMYLHFGGEGKPEQLAAAMQSALSLSGTPMKPPAAAQSAPKPDWSGVEKILGTSGKKKGNLIQYSFKRNEKVMEHGMEVPPYLGVAFPINLQMVGAKAASTGDFVLTAKEVNPVIKALLRHGIAVTAVHSHMLFESPRLFFLHFWAYDDPEKVATGLKAALEQANLKNKP